MGLLFLRLLVLLPLGKAAPHRDGRQSHTSVSPALLDRSRRELPVGNHEEAEEKPDLFVAVPHLIGAGEGQRQREKMLSRFGRFWKKPEREAPPSRDSVSGPFLSGTRALAQPRDGMQMEKSPLREEAKRFWHHFMFRTGPASQGIILPIKSHEVHQETCRTVPFSQVSVLEGAGGIGACKKGAGNWDRWKGGGKAARASPDSQIWPLGIHQRYWQSMVMLPRFPSNLPWFLGILETL